MQLMGVERLALRHFPNAIVRGCLWKEFAEIGDEFLIGRINLCPDLALNARLEFRALFLIQIADLPHARPE